MQNEEQAIRTLQALKDMGVQIAIDDFGTGYSSLSYLSRFPIDSLKIDQSFLKGIPGNQENASIIRAIIAMAHSMNLEVVAEGVETQEQLDFMCSMKCNKIQGFLFSEPIPPVEMTRLLKEKKSLPPCSCAEQD